VGAPGGDASSAGEEVAQGEAAMLPLPGHWLRDQSMAFAATQLGGLDVLAEPRSVACIKVLADGDGLKRIQQGWVSDSTLSLISSIHQDYLCETKLVEIHGLCELAKHAEKLERVVSAAKEELKKRDNALIGDTQKKQVGSVADSPNRLLIWHAAYLLKHPSIPARQFLKWLRAVVPKVVPNAVEDKALGKDTWLGNVANWELETSRAQNLPIPERLQWIDRLHKTVLDAIGERGETAAVWWTRICMAYRSSLFCWPLLTVGKQRRGLSLPVLLHVNEDGQSLAGEYSSNPKGQEIYVKCDLPGRKQVRFLGFNGDWKKAFIIGMNAAKILWESQNRRLEHEDSAAYHRTQTASLDVDLGAACEIVASIYSRVDANRWQGFNKPEGNGFFLLEDRSAEAYWAQCVLGLLSRHEVPLGVCTGTIEFDEKQREFKMQGVAAVVEKLEYANRAGIPRVVIPDDYDDDGEGAPHHEKKGDKRELKDLLRTLDEKGTLTVDFAHNVRAAADMIQSSGWRHSIFIRTHRFRRTSDETKRRLHYRDVYKDEDPGRKNNLKPEQVEWYEKRKWFDNEAGELERLDKLLRPSDKAIHYVDGDQLSNKVPNASSEDILGKWAAWKDHQARTGATNGNAGPGFSVLALRTAEGDSDLRLWAAVAQMLNANAAADDWWEKFRWSNLEGAATLLAQLLREPNAISRNSFGSAPDLLMIIDDAGMTRKDPVFPTMFEHAFSDLLDPGGALDNALKGHETGVPDIRLRIIVVTNPQERQQTNSQKGVQLKNPDRDILERLAIFRFAFSRHAGFAMANFDRNDHAWVQRHDFDKVVKRLRKEELITIYRDILQLTPKARQLLKDHAASGDGSEKFMQESWWWLARAHRHAACALCPILYPPGFRITTGRDGQLEPENMLEAQWHLQQAYALLPPRFRSRWMDKKAKNDMLMPGDSQILLAHLHATQDWDTVLILRTNYKARRDAIELSDHLLGKIRRSKDVQGSFSVNTGRAIESRGHFFKYGGYKLAEDQQQIEGGREINKIVKRCHRAAEYLEKGKITGMSPDECRRRRRHLYSRQLFALRMLGVSFEDERMQEAKRCLDQAVNEIMGPDFLGRIGGEGEGLEDFPIPKNCWRALWLDGKDEDTPGQDLLPLACSEYAYAAVRANHGKLREGQPWEEPWIAYFVLMGDKSIEPARIAEVLNLWWAFYVEKPKKDAEKPKMDPRSFGQRVLNLQSYMSNDNGRWEEVWSRKINQAIYNLWHYLMDAHTNHRLCGKETAAALRLINVLALQETLPAFNFLKVCGEHWLEHWPNLILKPVEAWPSPVRDACADAVVLEEWKALARSVIGHRAGWVAMLVNLKSLRDKKVRFGYIFDWLKALEEIGKDADGSSGSFSLKHADPENLLEDAKSMALVGECTSAMRCAMDAMDAMDKILDSKNGRRRGFPGHFRQQLNDIKTALFAPRVTTSAH